MDEAQRLLVKQSIAALRPHTQRLSDLFYSELFARDPQLEAVFRPDARSRLTKFTSMLSTFDNLKHLEKIAPALVALGKRHRQYGVRADHYATGEEAFMMSLRAVRGAEVTREELIAWRETFKAVIGLMTQAYTQRDESSYAAEDARLAHARATHDEQLLDAIGGAEVVRRVHARFYDVMFADEWLGRFFFGKSEEALIKKQTDFMVACFGGPNHYQGEPPGITHMHMLITDEQLDLRETILREAILAEGLSESIADRWLAVDSAFRSAIAKQDKGECVMRCMGQAPIVVPKPRGYPWPPKAE